MSNPSDIATGFYNKLLNKKQGLQKERMSICRSCKLYKDDEIFGEMCNKKLYLNPETNEVSKDIKSGFYRGCGCLLDAKTRVERTKCPINKW